ncbi:hypothetical protein [Mesorhizobium sp. M0633]|uniref:hypothetical protein n=1 Tax=Mesorhizobium sp. M0633 TaxID=2956977 RepID=UPI00333800CB
MIKGMILAPEATEQPIISKIHALRHVRAIAEVVAGIGISLSYVAVKRVLDALWKDDHIDPDPVTIRCGLCRTDTLVLRLGSTDGDLDASTDNSALIAAAVEGQFPGEHTQWAVNIVGRRASEKSCRRLRRGNKKRKGSRTFVCDLAHNIW